MRGLKKALLGSPQKWHQWRWVLRGGGLSFQKQARCWLLNGQVSPDLSGFIKKRVEDQHRIRRLAPNIGNIHRSLCLMSCSSGSERCLPRTSHNCRPREEHLLWADLNEEVFAGWTANNLVSLSRPCPPRRVAAPRWLHAWFSFLVFRLPLAPSTTLLRLYYCFLV